MRVKPVLPAGRASRALLLCAMNDLPSKYHPRRRASTPLPAHQQALGVLGGEAHSAISAVINKLRLDISLKARKPQKRGLVGWAAARPPPSPPLHAPAPDRRTPPPRRRLIDAAPAAACPSPACPLRSLAQIYKVEITGASLPRTAELGDALGGEDYGVEVRIVAIRHARLIRCTAPGRTQ